MQKQIISQQEFDKKVEIEAAHLTYIGRLKPQEATKKAQETVSERFAV